MQVPALTLIYNEVIRHVDRASGAVRLLAIDFAKAFELLPHSTILRSCTRCGLPSQVIKWLCSYLTDRRQRTRCGQDLSVLSSIPSGVPQGSVIGPLLFCPFAYFPLLLSPFPPSQLFARTLSSLSCPCCCKADDVTVLHFLRNSDDDKLQVELDNIVSWSACKGLTLNFSKCTVTDFVTKKTLVCSDIFCPNGEVLQRKDHIKILGVTFSHDLRWNYHFNSIIIKACLLKVHVCYT